MERLQELAQKYRSFEKNIADQYSNLKEFDMAYVGTLETRKNQIVEQIIKYIEEGDKDNG